MNSTGETSQKAQKSNQNIQVYVRLRPTNTREKLIRSNEVVEVQNHREVIAKQPVDSRTKKFTFDKAFGMDSKQHDVYKVVVAPLIEEVLSGYNCTVFAYGQTGTGKTYTMVGEEQPNLCCSWDDPSDVGIIPRALNHLFDELRLMDVEFAMRVSYLELYNEELCDLLSTDDSVKIRIFDDANKKGSVIVQGLEEIPVKGKDDVYKLLAKGQERRRTATTLMNAQSSRSHTVFSILVHIKENNVDGEEMLKIGKLNLVDLAGSENISKAGNEKGIRTRETVNINQSLLTLGRVITALVERTPHIPYRESKLTRLLQESLGGRTKTSIIATVSPGHKDLDETLSTLEYAHRAKNIQNKPEINQRLTKKAVLKEYTEEIDRLKRDLMAARDKNGIYLAEDTYNDMLYKMEEQTKELNDKVLYLKALKDELSSKTKLFEETQYHLEIVSENLAKTQDRVRITEADLVRAKKNLKHSKRKNEEKQFLLNQHMKTEAVLTNQAKELIQVATVASTDTKELHETIERRKMVEERVQLACNELTTNLNDYIHNMKLDMNQLTKKHSDNSNIIVHELKQNSTEHKKHIQELGKFLESVRIANEMSRSTLHQQVTEWRNQLQSKSDHDLDGIFQVLKQIEEKSENLNNYLIERIVAVTSQMYSEEKKNEDVLRQVISRLQHLNNNVENVCTHVTTNLSSFEEKLRAMDKKSHDEIKEQLANEKLLNEKQSKKLQEIRKMLDDVEDMQSQLNRNRETIETTNNDYLEKKMNVYNDLKVNHKCLQTCHEDVTSDSKEMQLSLEKIQESVKLSVNQQNHDLIEVKTKAKELNDQLVNCVHTDLNNLNGHRDYLNGNLHQITKSVQETNDKNDKDMLEKHEQLTGMVTSEKERLDTVKTNIETYVKGILNHIVQESEGHVMESLMKCADELSNFSEERLVKYEPTGSTPARKDYQFNRCLAATSPHDRLIRRMRFESGGNSDLDVSITILEDDENVTSPDLNSTSTEITNSTPVKDNNLQKGRVLQNLEISKVMNEQNKENVGSTWPQN